jgi:putative ABC transport system ATP-binding protein
MALIDELHAEGATIVVITHEHEIAARFPRQISLLDGRIVTDRCRPDTYSAPATDRRRSSR